MDGNYLFDPFYGAFSYGYYWDDLPEVIIVSVNQGPKELREADSQVDEETGLVFYDDKEEFNLDSCDDLTFEDFVSQLHTWDRTSTSNWYKPATQQMEWLSFIDESNNYIEADYIFKMETIEDDFKVLQDYFCSIEPLIPRDNYFIDLRSIEYRSVYNTETQNIVKKLFEKDIDRFEYTF